MTLIINRATIGYVDFDHGNVVNPTCLMKLDYGESEYLHKRIEKLFNLNIKEIKHMYKNYKNEFLKLGSEYQEDEVFLKASLQLFNRLTELKSFTDNPINSHVLFMNFILNENEFVTMITLENKKSDFFKIVYDKEGGIAWVKSSKWQMPSASSSVNEAIVMNVTNDKVYLLEKKVKIDDKKAFYLNEQWLNGYKQDSYKNILNNTLKAICSVKKSFGSENVDKTPIHFKEYINRLVENNEDIIPYSIPMNIPIKKDELKVTLTVLKDIGIDEDMIIQNSILDIVDDKYSKCKIKVDDEIEISMSVEDYLANKCQLVKKGDMSAVILKDVEFLQVE